MEKIASTMRDVVRPVLRLCCGVGLCLSGCAASAGDGMDPMPELPLRLAALNLRVNHAVVYAEDAVTSGGLDDWATPAELAARGAGDCEDFAIAKYFSLLDKGIPVQQLRIAYVELSGGGGERGERSARHMVLAWLPPGDAAAGEALILDNLLDAVHPLARRPDLRVLISFNSVGIWPGLQRGAPQRPARQLRRWAQVLDSVQAQGR